MECEPESNSQEPRPSNAARWWKLFVAICGFGVFSPAGTIVFLHLFDQWPNVIMSGLGTAILIFIGLHLVFGVIGAVLGWKVGGLLAKKKDWSWKSGALATGIAAGIPLGVFYWLDSRAKTDVSMWNLLGVFVAAVLIGGLYGHMLPNLMRRREEQKAATPDPKQSPP
jgi:hypothetical protein